MLLNKQLNYSLSNASNRAGKEQGRVKMITVIGDLPYFYVLDHQFDDDRVIVACLNCCDFNFVGEGI